MNLTRTLPLVTLLSSMAFSQTTGKPASPVPVLKQLSSAFLQDNCPIQVGARFYAVADTGGVKPIENGRMIERDQRIHIILSYPESEVASVRLTIYGISAGGRVDPAIACAMRRDSEVAHDSPAKIHKTISFDRAIGARQSASIDVSLRDFSNVSSVDLNSVSYSDGSSWHGANGRHCQAVGVPSGALLVDGPVNRR